ncbi:MAG: serine protease, partial [Candidatus Muirbacterium halophilum]|nr:serine protease [Candidatus Muirbacterium halophilum]
MKYLILISVILTFNFSAFSFDENIAKATVKIFNKSQSNSAYSPWDYSNVSGGTGSGVVLGEGRILTNAHVVSNSKYLYIKRNEDPYEYPAKIVHIAHECDLAVLDVTDNREEFYKKIAFAELGVSPQLREKVNTVGYPKGGSKISVTEGVVSRIEYHIYVHDGASKHLAIQTDAAINNGNSGGPVVKGGKVVGIAYQSRTDGQNIGYFIPLFVVERFLKDIDMDGKYDGYIDNGLIVSDMKNTGLKKYSGLSEDSGVGIIVTAIKRNSPLKNFIKKDDVILEIDGVSIADDATVTSEFGRVEWIHVLENKFINDKVKFKIMRDRKMKIVEAKMLPSENMISNVNQYEFDYPYFIKAGYVFTVLSRDYLESWGKNWYYDAELYQMFHYSFFEYMEKEKRDEIVVLSK